jgi:hypothetical protein
MRYLRDSLAFLHFTIFKTISLKTSVVMKNRKQVSYSLQLMIQLQKLSSRERQSGYALLMASVMSILIFSMLTVYMFSSRISKSTTDAMVDAGSTFYAAEFGLNSRANDMRSRIGNFSRPTGVSPTDTSASTASVGESVASMMASCLGTNNALKGSGDFACTENSSDYAESITSGNRQERRTSSNIKYKTYSFVQDLTPGTVALTVIPANNNFAGLRASDYQYRVYSTALKQADGSSNVSAQAMLQMRFTDRFIPIFQFAAFYQGDLEITSTPNMSIDGPIHSNAGIYLAPGNLLTLNGNVTYVDGIYRSLRYRATSTAGVRSILFSGGGPYPDTAVNCNGVTNGCVDAAPAWASGVDLPLEISPESVAASNNAIRSTGPLRLPPSGFLSQTQANGSPGTYYNKADLRVTFDPRNATNPRFNITRMDQTNEAPASVEDFSTRPGLINSLQKPVMLRVTNDAARSFSEVVRLCPKLDGSAGEPNPNDPVLTRRAIPNLPATLTSTTNLLKLNNPANVSLSLANRQNVINALRQAIIMSSVSDITYAQTKSPATGTLLANFRTLLTARFTNTERNIITAARINEIAALNTNSLTGNGGCFLPAPMQILLPNSLPNPLFDKREGRNMYILQSNIKSLTAWNRDGVYGDGTITGAQLPTDGKLFTRKPLAALATVDQLPANDATNTSNVAGANCDYDCLGLGSVDGERSPTAAATTQGGLVWHYSLINRNNIYNYASNSSDADATPPVVAVRDATLGVSQYGFAFSGGARLPGALTIASDQAVYVQGDFNNPSSFPGTIPAVTTPPTLDPLDTPAIGLNRTATTNPPAKEKRPAAILADSAIVLSNNCSDTSFRLSCLRTFTETAVGSGIGTPMPVAATTVVRAAILAGTEATNVANNETSGGLNNHLSFRENWAGQTIKYRGSLVSKGIPNEFNGIFIPGCPGNCGAIQHINTYFSPPARDFGFETDFNSITGLPPLTPNVNLLIQRVYKRDYDPLNRG